MVINTNISAQVAASNLQTSQSNLSKSLARLSSGSKIVNPADDAAGLAVASRFDAQIQRLGAARSNVGNAISLNGNGSAHRFVIGDVEASRRYVTRCVQRP